MITIFLQYKTNKKKTKGEKKKKRKINLNIYWFKILTKKQCKIFQLKIINTPINILICIHSTYPARNIITNYPDRFTIKTPPLSHTSNTTSPLHLWCIITLCINTSFSIHQITSIIHSITLINTIPRRKIL